VEADAARPRGVIKAGPAPTPTPASALVAGAGAGASVPGTDVVVEAPPAVVPVRPGTVLGASFSTRGSSPTASSTSVDVSSVGGSG
jgi:hypothetical protein